MVKRKRDSCPLFVKARIWFGKWNNRDCLFGLSKNLSKEQESLQKFKKFFENNPALMAVSSFPEQKFIEVNSSFIENLGYSHDEIIGHSTEDLDLFPQPEKQLKVVEELQKNGRIHNVELQAKCKNGNILEGLFFSELIKSQGKEYFLTVMVDITRQKSLQNLYDNEKTRLHSIIEGTRLGTWEWNIQSGETTFNERWAEIIGYTLKELEPVSIDTWEKYSHPDDLNEAEKLLEKHFKGESDYYDCECRMKHKRGHWVWVHDRGKVIEWDDEGKPLMMYGTHSDISDKKEMDMKIMELSIRDPLTNVFNRRYIYDRVGKDILRFQRTKIEFSISILDIDFFKRVNDSYGHQAGDFILKEFTGIIASNLRESDLLGRYGGEEFIVVTYESSREKTAALMERILEAVRAKIFEYENDEIKITFSAGISDVSESSNETTTIEKIISIADQRLYYAKTTGRNKVQSEYPG